jgi:hypothetical protein
VNSRKSELIIQNKTNSWNIPVGNSKCFDYRRFEPKSGWREPASWKGAAGKISGISCKFGGGRSKFSETLSTSGFGDIRLPVERIYQAVQLREWVEHR